jgi:hypothetical protein
MRGRAAHWIQKEASVERVRLTNEVPAPKKAQPQGTDGPTEAEAAQLAALQAKAQKEESDEE